MAEPLTTGQWNAIKDHANLEWLRQKAAKNHPVHADTTKEKITVALKSSDKTSDRVTDKVIGWVSVKVGTPWGDFYKPEPVYKGRVHIAAVNEISGSDKDLAQAVRMIFGGTAGGRSSPDADNVNHIHVGGNAQLNILFDTETNTILGLVDGHMDKNMSPSVRSEAARVTGRKGGASVEKQLQGNIIN